MEIFVICAFIALVLTGFKIAVTFADTYLRKHNKNFELPKFWAQVKALTSSENTSRNQRICLKIIQSILIVAAIIGAIYSNSAPIAHTSSPHPVLAWILIIVLSVTSFLGIILLCSIVVAPMQFLTLCAFDQLVDFSKKSQRILVIVKNSITLCIGIAFFIFFYENISEIFMTTAVSTILTILFGFVWETVIMITILTFELIKDITKSYLKWLLK